MNRTKIPWSLVLAGGDGKRLSSLTTDRRGVSTPKQFCALQGGVSLLELALRRAARVTPADRITTIVAAQHRRWWEAELSGLPSSNIVMQPSNRGTAAGILLPLLCILARDPEAHIVFLPSDHFIADEAVLEHSIRRALSELERVPDGLILLGMTPDELDSEFGWIVPNGRCDRNVRRVDRFVEKPCLDVAKKLLEQGGLWNSFIFVASGATVLSLFDRRLPELSAVMQTALMHDGFDTHAPWGLSALYENLDTADFCGDLLQGAEDLLWTVPVAPCGWNDLGTADRVARCVGRLPERLLPMPGPVATTGRAPLELARVASRP